MKILQFHNTFVNMDDVKTIETETATRYGYGDQAFSVRDNAVRITFKNDEERTFIYPSKYSLDDLNTVIIMAVNAAATCVSIEDKLEQLEHALRY